MGLERFLSSSYACGFDFLTDSSYLRYVGTPDEHKQRAEMRREILEYVLSWVHRVERSNKDIQRFVNHPGGGAEEEIAAELGRLGVQFDVVFVSEDGFYEPSSGDWTISAPIAGHWPEDVQRQLYATAVLCADICLRAKDELSRRKLTFKPYDRLICTIYERGLPAADLALGACKNLSGDGDAGKLPPELEEELTRVTMLALGSLAAQTE